MILVLLILCNPTIPDLLPDHLFPVLGLYLLFGTHLLNNVVVNI